MIWSAVLSFTSLLGLFLISRKIRVGWLINIGQQGLWLTYAVSTQQYPFIASSLIFGLVSFDGWRRSKETNDPQVDA